MYMNRFKRSVLGKRQEQNEVEVENYKKQVQELFAEKIYKISR